MKIEIIYDKPDFIVVKDGKVRINRTVQEYDLEDIYCERGLPLGMEAELVDLLLED